MKKRNFFFIYFSLVSLTFSFAQAPVIQWQKSIGGSNADHSYAVLQNSDSTYIIAGSSSSSDGDISMNYGLDDYLIMKTNAYGTILWEHTYGGSDYDVAYCVNKTNDGGYILCGEGGSNDDDITVNYGDSDFWVVKVNSNGALQWQKSYGGTNEDNASYVLQTTDGGYIVSGYSSSNNFDVTGNHGLGDYWVVKTSSVGVIQWEKSYGGSAMDYGQVIKQTIDGGYIICGTSQSNDGDATGNHGLQDYWVIKISSTGTLQWQKSYGGSASDYAKDIQLTNDGGYIVFGRSNSTDGDITDNHGNDDYWVVKINNTGTIQWKKSYGGSLFDEGNSILQTTDGGYLLSGQSSSADGDKTFTDGGYDNWLVKISNSGALLWQKDFGGSVDENAMAVATTLDGGVIVCGASTSNDVDVTGNHGFADAWVVKFNTTVGVKEQDQNNELSFFPNPCKNKFTVKTGLDNETVTVTLTDMLGKTLVTKTSISINTIAAFDLDEDNGVYFLKIKNASKEVITKLIIAK